MAERQLSEAEASFVAGRLDEVVRFGDLIAADPDCHQAFYLGRTCMSLGKFDEAREMIEQATRIRRMAYIRNSKSVGIFRSVRLRSHLSDRHHSCTRFC